MKKIFEEARIGGILSKNRIIRSATQEGLAVDDGQIGEELISVYKSLAEGGVGIIITSMVGVDENSRVFPLMMKSYDDSFISGLKKIVKNAHDNNCKIVVQLAHNGIKANPDNGSNPFAPSDMKFSEKDAKGMTKEDIDNLIESFALAALRCKEAGADGVQIHGAHGYLLSEFLSPYFNQRSDEYGGSISNRARIIFEIYDAIRTKVQTDYPVWIKINSEDFVDNGLSHDESLWVCKELDKRGINGIEVSGGIGISAKSAPTRITSKKNEKGTFSDYALTIADSVNTSVISVGGYRTPDMIENWLNKGKLQAFSLCRPLICEPDLPNAWKNNDMRKAKCVSCNKCFDYSTSFGCKVFPQEVVL